MLCEFVLRFPFPEENRMLWPRVVAVFVPATEPLETPAIDGPQELLTMSIHGWLAAQLSGPSPSPSTSTISALGLEP
jgi:hypothetical protein